MNLSAHFSLAELVASDLAERYGIDNIPDDPHITGNLYFLAGGLERCRVILDKPMIVTSGYRCQRLNALVRGARNSAHQFGLAADFRVPGMAALDVCLALKDRLQTIGFDQLILEGNWTHIAFPSEGKPPRYSMMTAIFAPGSQTTYKEGFA